MSRLDDLQQENEALRERLSGLSEASVRIHESLDFETVLQGVLDSARALTDARYGVITLLDGEGSVRDFLSSGMTAEEALSIWNTRDGVRIAEYLTAIPGPLRIPDLLGELRARGLPAFPPPRAAGSTLSFLTAPLLHRGERMGTIHVAHKEAAPEFTPEDEETLVLFASQAALVIANARRYREEKRARADLETLIDTSPVGVVVFDARTGAPRSFNREARRLVDGLLEPGQTPEQLLEVITVDDGAGRELALNEFPLVQALRAAKTVRAVEIVMRVPDGRSVTVLVNATPIPSADGAVESLVVTLQDLAPVQELERLRAEFLAMVSHELRTPLTSIKGAAATALGRSSAPQQAELVHLFRIVDHQSDRMRDLIAGLLDVARIETGTLPLNPEPVDPASLVTEACTAFPLAGDEHPLEVDLPPDLPWVMADRGRIVHVLGTLFGNAARRAREGTPIRVTAEREGVYLALSVGYQSEGAVPEHLLPFFRKFPRIDGGDPGADPGGWNLGLAVCKGVVDAHGGRIRGETAGPGLGSRFAFTLPAVDPGALAGPAELASSVAGSSPPSRGQARILAVDADPETLRHVRDGLSTAGYSVVVTSDPRDVSRLVEEEQPHLVVLDLLLPGSDGFELMTDILESAGVPVIFLSAYGDEEVIARALDRGAADYVVKPFSGTELAARIRAALRRQAAPAWTDAPEPYRSGDLRIDFGERRVTVAGRSAELTATEFEVLRRLALDGGRVVTHDQLLQSVWSPERTGEPWLVRNVVKRLRRKLGDNAADPAYILTEPRVGYRVPRPDGQDPAQ